MEYGTRVYIFSKDREGVCEGVTHQSGYQMVLVDESAYYLSDTLNMDIEYTNAELWEIVDNSSFPIGMIIVDQEGNEFIYCGKSFQLYSEHDDNKFRGFCKGDKWKLSRIKNLNKII
ncbi:hypothetical protein ABHN03_16900 [Paenibacillus sp. NRS-1775]|uniref:hypothetical protein n=1 Tax=unclassified Paenibacillus TaxID=185978 RepID=UPI003D281C85